MVRELGLGAAAGGLIAVGPMYLLFNGLVRLFGTDRLLWVFPPVVTGPVIIVIGLGPSDVVVDQAKTDWRLALATLLASVAASVFGHGLFRMIPILVGVVSGYLVALAIIAPVAVVTFATTYAENTGCSP